MNLIDIINKHKSFLLLFCLLTVFHDSFSQSENRQVLFIIDSIPLINDPEPWNPILQEDIADYVTITNRDSLLSLGWQKMNCIIYIFTKEYRNRPDSIRRIPGLRQMVLKDGNWTLKENLYSGKYIDYYNNGKIQNEGTLRNGKLNGELIVYYATGVKKSVTNYKDGVRHGMWMDYYQNGKLMRVNEFVNGKANRIGKLYFINGQVQHELRLKKRTAYDTAVSYYSTGLVRDMAFTNTGVFKQNKKSTDLSYHTTMFYQYLRTGDIKAANKNFYQIWLLDSTNIDTYFKEGLLLSHEFRFDEAILKFNKALIIEPMMKEALEQRAIALIKKYKFETLNISSPEEKNQPLILEDVMRMSKEEQSRVCSDILLADELDPGVNYNNKPIPQAILNYCKKKNNR